MSAATLVVESARHYLSLANTDLATGYLTLPRKQVPPPEESLAAAIDWICRAQDASGDGGVARSYSIAYHRFFKRRGWLPSYPETTGYIVPTLFDYAKRVGREDLYVRAVRMADWESNIQMSNGAVMGGTVDAPAAPAIFNTGQVLFGWVRAFQETGDQRYLDSAVRAGDFLLSAQDTDGAWRKSLGHFASAELASYTYNTRSAWALLLLADAAQSAEYRKAAIRNIDFALTEQLPNGWFKNNCLWDPVRPLLHTIAYALRGILEVGLAVQNDTYIAAARKAADALLLQQNEDGSLAGRFTSDWQPAVRFSCLTGNVQMGTVWAGLYRHTGDEKYLRALSKANRFTQSVQWLGTGNPGLDGGISGAFPLHGRYGRFEVLNWAVKFFADSLMLEADVTSRCAHATPQQMAGAVR
jgi:rhamnogalacturonyl hydrolase YesR